jgi:hypothetical protein
MAKKTTEQRYILEAIHAGNQANNAIADVVVSNAQKMLDEALQDNFETILQAKLSAAIQETINLHTDRTKALAKKFLGTSKTQLAQNMIDTQHSHRMTALRSNLDLSDLTAFDTELSPEVGRLADEAGTMTIEVNESSSVGF